MMMMQDLDQQVGGNPFTDLTRRVTLS